MSERPDISKLLMNAGCLMMLIPVVLVLGVLFVVIALAGGTEGIVIALLFVVGVALLVARARRR